MAKKVKEITATYHDGRPAQKGAFSPGKHLRQGDTLLTMMDAIPAGATKSSLKGGVIAEGEVTGHAHRLTGKYEVFEAEGKTYFKAGKGGVNYVHEDHGHLHLPENTSYCIGSHTAKPAAPVAGADTGTTPAMGRGSITTQREWSPEGNRAVRD